MTSVLTVTGGKKHERDIAKTVVRWCFTNKVVIHHDIDIYVKICKYRRYQCWGSCVESDYNNTPMTKFNITVANNQSIRDFVATIIHEMIHVNQYITGTWEGDGEEECEKKQFTLTDELWRQNTI